MEEDLREACALGDVDRASQLIKNGVNINSANPMNGWTALHWACHREHVEIAQLLMKHGAKELPNDKGDLPRQVAKGVCCDLFGVSIQSKQEEEVEFTPNYLRPVEQKMEKTIPMVHSKMMLIPISTKEGIIGAVVVPENASFHLVLEKAKQEFDEFPSFHHLYRLDPRVKIHKNQYNQQLSSHGARSLLLE